MSLLNDTENKYKKFNSLNLHLSEIRNFQLLTRDEERRLFEEYNRGSIEAKNKIINSNLRLVVSIAKNYYIKNPKIDLMSLISEGHIGLIKAVKRFDITKDCKFSTYATYWIRQTLYRSFNLSCTIQHSHQDEELLRKIKEYRQKYYQKHGIDPDIDMCIEELNIDKEIALNLLMNGTELFSMDAALNEETENTMHDYIGKSDNGYDDVEDSILKEEIFERIKESLDEREYQIISMRFGIGLEKEKTLLEVAKICKITPERVRQIEAKALRKLRKIFATDENIRVR